MVGGEMRQRTLDTRFVWVKPETEFTWFGDHRLRWPDERKGGNTVTYQPPLSLFRIFAALKSNKSAGVLSFANTYGDILGVPGSERIQLDETALDGRRTVRPYAALRVWNQQIKQMQYAVDLWDICNAAPDAGADETARKEEARMQARKQLQIEIESALRDVKTPSCARVLLNQNMELFVCPVNLLAFMWLTLARLLSGQIGEQECSGNRNSESCLGFIYTGSGLRKTGIMACGPACRKWTERHKKLSIIAG
jgi:hypothetical protein